MFPVENSLPPPPLWEQEVRLCQDFSPTARKGLSENMLSDSFGGSQDPELPEWYFVNLRYYFSTGHSQHYADFTKTNQNEFVRTFWNIYKFANVNS